MNIIEADEILANKFPTTSFCITMELWNHAKPTCANKEHWKLEYRWRIWDGTAGFDGDTLAIAVKECLNANDPALKLAPIIDELANVPQ